MASKSQKAIYFTPLQESGWLIETKKKNLSQFDG